MLSHYVWEFKSSNLSKITKIKNKNKTISICQKNESFIYMAERLLLLSQQLLKVSTVCSHTCTQTVLTARQLG